MKVYKDPLLKMEQKSCVWLLPVGGFNMFQPNWNILVKWDHISSGRGENKNYLKPQPIVITNCLDYFWWITFP